MLATDEAPTFAELLQQLSAAHALELQGLESEISGLRSRLESAEKKVETLQAKQAAPAGGEDASDVDGSQPCSDVTPTPRNQHIEEKLQPRSSLASCSSQASNLKWGSGATLRHVRPALWRSNTTLGSTHRKDSLFNTNLDLNVVDEGGIPPSCTIKGIVSSTAFEVTFSIIIMANAATMALQLHCSGMTVGIDLGFFGNDGASTCSPNVVRILSASDWAFGGAFMLEWLMKLYSERCDFVWSAWNWVDTVIVAFWLLPPTLPVNIVLIRMARLVRLLRLLRLARAAKELDSIFLMATAIKGSVTCLAWAMVLLFIMQLMVALFLMQVLQDMYLNSPDAPLEYRLQVFQYFGTTSRAMLSMFEVTLANWPPICRLLTEHVSEYFMVFAVLHKLVIGFAVVGVINGVFMQETFQAAASDDRIMMRQKERAAAAFAKKMRRLFQEADYDDGGYIERPEIHEMLQKPQVRTWLSSMGIEPGDPDTFFSLLDKGDGKVDLDQLVAGCKKIQGPAKSIDMQLVLKEVKKLRAEVKATQKASKVVHVCSKNGQYGLQVVSEAAASHSEASFEVVGDKPLPAAPCAMAAAPPLPVAAAPGAVKEGHCLRGAACASAAPVGAPSALPGFLEAGGTEQVVKDGRVMLRL